MLSATNNLTFQVKHGNVIIYVMPLLNSNSYIPSVVLVLVVFTQAWCYDPEYSLECIIYVSNSGSFRTSLQLITFLTMI